MWLFSVVCMHVALFFSQNMHPVYGGSFHCSNFIFTGFRMSMHSTEAKELPAVSVSKVDFETAAVIAINEDISRFTMVKVHGK